MLVRERHELGVVSSFRQDSQKIWAEGHGERHTEPAAEIGRLHEVDHHVRMQVRNQHQVEQDSGPFLLAAFLYCLAQGCDTLEIQRPRSADHEIGATTRHRDREVSVRHAYPVDRPSPAPTPPGTRHMGFRLGWWDIGTSPRRVHERNPGSIPDAGMLYQAALPYSVRPGAQTMPVRPRVARDRTPTLECNGTF